MTDNYAAVFACDNRIGPRRALLAGEIMATHRGGPERPAGLRDVARMAGVSVATASLALTGQPGVADSTRRRIVAVAEQLGYHANPQAQALRRGRTTTYGFVVRNFANPFFLEVLSGPSRSRRSQATDGVSRRRAGLPGQRGRGRAGGAPAGRARSYLHRVPVGAARPHGGPGPAAPFPAAGRCNLICGLVSCTRCSPWPTCSWPPGDCR